MIKAPYDPIPLKDKTFCPNCGIENEDLIETSDGCRGCTLCITECKNCGWKSFPDEMSKDYLIRYGSVWLEGYVCSHCIEMHTKDPDIYDEIKLKDPGLFDKLHKILKPDNI